MARRLLLAASHPESARLIASDTSEQDSANAETKTHNIQRDAHGPRFPPTQHLSLVPIVSKLEICRLAHRLGPQRARFCCACIGIGVHVALGIVPRGSPIRHLFRTWDLSIPERRPARQHEAIDNVASVRKDDRVHLDSPGFAPRYDDQIVGAKRWV